MDLRFDGKRALVTGAGKGIGRGIAIKLSELGAEVIALSRTQEDLDSLQLEVPAIKVHTIDLRDWETTSRLVQGLGPIDLLVNNAGNNILRSFLEVTKEDLDSQFNVNFMAPYNISQIVAKGMVERKKGGAIVMISSIAGMRALEKRTVYCSTKGALDQLTRCLALELGPHQIRVNSVNPTVVLTALAKRSGWDKPEIAGKMMNRIPLGHFAEVEDIVNATLYLLSDKASMINGLIMPVDGGITATL